MDTRKFDKAFRRIGLKGEEISMRALAGGITNSNFLIESGGQRFVGRLVGEHSELLGIDRANEARIATIIAHAKIGPVVAFSDPDEGVLLTEFIDGDPLSRQALENEHVLKSVVATIRRIHDGPRFPGQFCPFETVRKYHRRATEHGVRLPREVDPALRCLDRIERAISRERVLRPCHNDLLAANFIAQEEKFWVLDWEYAAMGDPFFDLGNFAANQELTAHQCMRLIEFYSGEPDNIALARVILMRLVSDMREAFWGFLQSGISSLDFDFTEYALKHLERFGMAAERPEFQEGLRLVERREPALLK